jgi:hypothetical protein
MRKTLLIAAAALAGSVISSQAGVYSQNIVGYVNVPTINPAYDYCLAVPFTIGSSNGANEVFPGTALPEYSQLLTYNPATGGYTTYFNVYAADGSVTGWQNPSFADVPPPTLPVGKGFFLNPSAPTTNTFAGAVALNVGTTNSISLPNPAYDYLVGELVPYGGAAATNSPINLSGQYSTLPDYSQVLVYNPTTGGYTTYFIVSPATAGTSTATGWQDPSFNDVPPPTITPGQGIFINPAGAASWTQNL